MKVAFYLSILIMALNSCGSQKKAVSSLNNTEKEVTTEGSNQKATEMENLQEIPLIVYESMSRGYYSKITIERDQLTYQKNRESQAKTRKLTSEEIKKIWEEYSQIKVEEFPNLKAPTQKRFYDGAPITNLKVTKGDQTFLTPDFDGGFPPSEIEKFVNTLLKIVEE